MALLTAGEMLRHTLRTMADLHSVQCSAHKGFVLDGGYLLHVALPSRLAG